MQTEGVSEAHGPFYVLTEFGEFDIIYMELLAITVNNIFIFGTIIALYIISLMGGRGYAESKTAPYRLCTPCN